MDGSTVVVTSFDHLGNKTVPHSLIFTFKVQYMVDMS